ncbi:MAG: type I CRISPR-associated protein Cas7 [Candidatus Absconditabacterales bacterium]|nr:type I CRISPR-associated protein Cas7 [Candidatus Absconditabacterales bacterium]
MSKDKFNSRCYAISLIESNNSNFNADFTGNPRRLPDEKGTIFATDKVYKYAMRRFWIDNNKDVFVWRSHNDNGKLKTREERMEFMKEKLKNNENLKELNDKKSKIKSEIKNIKNPTTNEGKKIKKEKELEIEVVNQKITKFIFSECIDTKLFGVTYTGKDNSIALTGPVQISYGVNRLNSNTNYIVDILSPYPNTEGEGEDEKVKNQGSIGKDMKNLKTYYAYDVSLNPKNITSHYSEDKYLKNIMALNDNDINDLKEALKKSVTSLDTTSKKDSENIMLLFIKMNDCQEFLPSMKNLVDINYDEKGQVSVDLKKIFCLLKDKKDSINEINLIYNKYKIVIDCGDLKDENNFEEKVTIDTTL